MAWCQKTRSMPRRHFLRGGRTWESEAAEAPAPVSSVRWAVAAALATAFSATVFAAVVTQEHHPFRPLLADLDGIDETADARLRAAGLGTPERLFARAGKMGTDRLAERLGLDAGALEQARRHAALSIHKGLGTEMARLLLEAGVDDVRELAAAEADVLAERLAELASRSGIEPPSTAMVKVWVRAARWNGQPRR